jgi:hypothetical protein
MAAVVAALVAASGARQSPVARGAPDDTPEACVARLIAAEGAGDRADYLACFVEARHPAISAGWRGRPAAHVAADLRDRASDLTGYAVTDVSVSASEQATLVLERIYRERHARQRVHLVREAGGWRIDELGPAESQTPAVRYGQSLLPATGAAGREP